MVVTAKLGRKKLINLTEHVVNVYKNGRVILEIPPSGHVARCKVEEVEVGKLGEVPLLKTRYGQVEGLLEPQEGVLYIVSYPVANASRDRKDLIVPARLVRDKQGNIIGCKAFQVIGGR